MTWFEMSTAQWLGVLGERYRRWVVIEHHAQQIHHTLDRLLAVRERITLDEFNETAGARRESTADPQKMAHVDRPLDDQQLLDAVVTILDHLTQMAEAAGYTIDDALDGTRARPPDDGTA